MTRPTTEGCMSIGVRSWHREGRLRPGQCFAHSLTWMWEPTEGIGVRTKADAVVLMFRSRSWRLLLGLRRWGNAGEKPMIPSPVWWLSAVAAVAVSFAVLSPAMAQAPAVATPPAVTPDDPFGEEVTLLEKTIVYVAGSAMWDSAFNTIVDGFKTVHGAMAKLGLKASGASMIIYTETDDTGFHFQAQYRWRRRPLCRRTAGSRLASRPQARPSSSSIVAPMTTWTRPMS
jgi:hypothetical protein